jgi:glycine cleavage system transcriptional repressor
MSRSAHFAVTVISKDRPGIVADTTEILLRLGCNLEDSSCTLLGGDFAMILTVSHPTPFAKSRLVDEFRRLHEEKGLVAHVRSLSEEELKRVSPTGELCLISVYGADRPGIVYRVTRELADHQVSIADLNTKLVGSREEPVYVMLLEAYLPQGSDLDTLERIVAGLRRELQVEIGVRVITPVLL